MGSEQSAKKAYAAYVKKKNRPVKRWTREEILKALTVQTSVDENGKVTVKSPFLDLLQREEETAGKEFAWASIYVDDDPFKEEAAAKAMGKTPFADKHEDRAFGAMLGLVVGDALGAPLEFKPVDYEANDVKGMGTTRGGKFMIEPGQWTDDTSLALCLADSLLLTGHYEPHHMMHYFLAWWYCGLNNGTRMLDDKDYHTSFGLGGTMKSAFRCYISEPAVETVSGTKECSGNGSLMRLAPVPIFFRKDIEAAEKCAAAQSLLTHQGTEAAECCRLMAHIMVRGLAGEELHDVLESLGTSFKTTCPGVIALSRSEAEKLKEADKKKTVKEETPKEESPKEESPKEESPKEESPKEESPKEDAPKEESPKEEAHKEEAEIDPDRNWNWKAENFRYSPTRVKQNPGYIGSYAMDGLAMALHILWSTSSFSEAVLKAVNLRGDADTVGAIVGQIAGAFYGCSSIPEEWKKTVNRYDNNEIALRAYRLYNHQLLDGK